MLHFKPLTLADYDAVCKYLAYEKENICDTLPGTIFMWRHHFGTAFCIDEDMFLMQHKKIMLDALDSKMNCDETDAVIKKLGAFAILTSEEVPEEKILPMYYTRQQVEQVFDISKNYADLIPIRVQDEQAFAGHLLLCFMATVIIQKLQQELLKRRSKKAKAFNVESILVRKNFIKALVKGLSHKVFL